MLKISELINGEIYQSKNRRGLFLFQCSQSGTTNMAHRICMPKSYSKGGAFGTGMSIEKNLQYATEANKYWLLACIKNQGWLPFNENMLPVYDIF